MRQTPTVSRRGPVGLYIAGCVVLTLYLLMTASFVLTSEKKAALLAAFVVLIVALTPQFRRRIRERCSLFFLLTTAYVILAGASTLYGRAPKLAISDFARYLAGYAVFLTIFAFVRPETSNRWFGVLAGSTAAVSFLSLDAASWGLVAEPLLAAAGSLIGGYSPETYGFTGSRINGIFGSSNTMACMAALGIFFALYLLLRKNGTGRILPALALFLNAYAFLMCTSLGATAALGLTCLLVLVFLSGREARLRFLWVVLETLLIAGAAVVLSLSHFGSESTTGYVVWLCALGGAALLWALDLLIRDRLVAVLCRRLRALVIGLAVAAVALVAAVIVAFSWTAPITLTGTSSLLKIIYPGEGDCTITVEADGPVRAIVYSRTAVQNSMGTDTLLLNEDVDGPFTVEVPEDAELLRLYFRPATDTESVTVQSVSYEGTERSGTPPASYRLIPLSYQNRLQGLRHNESAAIRFVMMTDGLRMWQTDPIFGRGLGGYENGLASVQDYYYETGYAHNHYIQSLTELGIVGLLLYVGMLVFGFLALWPLRKKGDAGLFPALMGVLLMIAIHSAIEFSMSLGEVILFAFAAFGLLAAEAPPLFAKPKAQRRAVTAVTAVEAVFGGVFALLLCLNFYAASLVSDGSVTMEELASGASMDVFEGDDFRLTYIYNAPGQENAAVTTQALAYAERLSRGHSNATGPVVTEFYLQMGMYEEAVAASDRYLAYTRSKESNWNDQLHLFQRYLNAADAEGQAVLMDAATATWEQMAAVSDQQLDDLALDLQAATFVGRMRACEGDASRISSVLGSLFYDSAYAPDTNGDGCPDNNLIAAGQVQWDGQGGVTAEADTTLRVRLPALVPGTYRITVYTDTPDLVSCAAIGYEGQMEIGEGVVSQTFVIDAVPEEDLLQFQVALPAGTGARQILLERAE